MAPSDPFRPSTASTSSAGDTATSVKEKVSEVKDKVADVAGQARDKAAELGSNAADAIDSGLHTAAGKLQDTAESLRSTGASGSSRVSDVTNRAAAGLEATARYFQDVDTRQMMSSMESIIRRNPGPSLIAAAVCGFLIGSALRDRD